MARITLRVEPGNEPPAELADALMKLFGGKSVDGLRKRGGRVTISVIAAPDPSIRDVKRCHDFDENTLSRLEKVKYDTPSLTYLLERMTASQLRETCRRMNIPYRSKATVRELQSQVMESLHTVDTWRKIAGRPAVNEPI